MMRCLFHRSAATPANGARKNAGIWLLKPTSPRRNAELVMRYTSQLIAVCCIHVPMSETPCPTKKRRKFLERRERKRI